MKDAAAALSGCAEDGSSWIGEVFEDWKSANSSSSSNTFDASTGF